MAVWNYENAAHLLRRTAFGGTPAEIQGFYERHGSVASAVAELLSFPPSSKKPPKGGNDFSDGVLRQQRWWLKAMLRGKTPSVRFQENMVLFWHNHLASGHSKQPTTAYMAQQNGLFRLFARGNFKNLMREFNRDPANLYYLDGILNRASNDGVHVNANENFAREIMELFTLGVKQLADDGSDDATKPNYTEADVHQLARALTGWIDITGKGVGAWYELAWDGGQYDDDGDDVPDPVTIFGTTNNNFRIDDDVAGTADDVLELLFARVDDAGNNQTAMFLARKLWTWLAYPAPAPGMKAMLGGLASTFVAAQFEVTALLQAILEHDEFYSDRARSRTVANPVQYTIGALRAFGVHGNVKEIGESPLELAQMIRDMGMELFEPPNVAGWPGGARWITTGTLLNRIGFARYLSEAESGSMRLRLSSIEGLPLGESAADPEAVLDAILHTLGLDVGPRALTTAQRDILIDVATEYGTYPTFDLSSEYTDDAVLRVRGMIGLAMQSAEYQIV